VREDRVTLVPWYQPKGPDDVTLVFESRFEGGNLYQVFWTRALVGLRF
jgi:hypothetical protein